MPFGAKDFSDLITRMDILKRIIKHDYELVMVVREKQNVIKTARAELEKDKEALHGLGEDAAKKKMDMEDKKAGNPEYSYISSSVVRELLTFGGDITRWVPPSVVEVIDKKRKREAQQI